MPATTSRDRDLRAALVSQIRASARPGRILHEVWIPRTHERIDVAEVNGHLTGYELKSARDTLARLPRQISAFSRVFEELSVVCDRRHTEAVSELTPAWCGILESRTEAGANALAWVRASRPNPAIDQELQIRLLWRDEMSPAVERLGIDPRSLTCGEMRQLLVRELNANAFSNLIRQQLRRRDLSRRRF